ncbi:MAG: adenylate cyclase, partial [Patescibacteria group bacterium]
EGRRLEKTRYMIPHKDTTLELDIYGGSLEGLIVVEVEFPSEELSEKFDVPVWFGEETTDDKRYKNQSLALHGDPRKIA